MKSEEIKELFKQFESIVCEYNKVECWSARELYPLLGPRTPTGIRGYLRQSA